MPGHFMTIRDIEDAGLKEGDEVELFNYDDDVEK